MPPNCWTVGVSTVTFQDIRWGYCHIRSSNLLPNVLGKQYAKEHGAFEALFFRSDDKGKYLTEGPSSTIFCAKKGTPQLDNILPGTTRKYVTELAKKQGIEVRECRLYLNDFLNSDEAFITSTVSEVMPVIKVDDTALSDGTKGKTTDRLQSLYWDFKKGHMEWAVVSGGERWAQA